MGVSFRRGFQAGFLHFSDEVEGEVLGGVERVGGASIDENFVQFASDFEFSG